MRLSASAIALIWAGAHAFSIGSDGQSVVVEDELDVPGQSPLKFCEADRANDIITIEQVVLSPNPPQAGTTLTIEASGYVKETIEDGAYVQLQVKYGYIKLLDTKADLCEQIKNVDLECPIEKGKISIVKDIELPNEIPPGKYTVQADVFTEAGDHITCLTATVFFGRKSVPFLDL
ncbi:Phosphatidylglycerol/phosphatidylinositol transfer protein [Echria macrotheca]|uniref:Phosphatidylglycerol/phosphatidylinositol transfer protein n=1 Tax=Echria macrotheca TaxID=438768 RepID=A0AAJ0BJA8_9PEZI|nr:Phosphatidylglycerol/phosphatidylinositol transfer protein [Echria macrotheca]